MVTTFTACEMDEDVLAASRSIPRLASSPYPSRPARGPGPARRGLGHPPRHRHRRLPLLARARRLPALPRAHGPRQGPGRRRPRRRAGGPSDRAGRPRSSDYFAEAVEPLVDGERVRYAGGSDPRSATGCSRERQRWCSQTPTRSRSARDGGGDGLPHAGARRRHGNRAQDRRSRASPAHGRNGAAWRSSSAPTVALDRHRVRERAGGPLRYARMVDDYGPVRGHSSASRSPSVMSGGMY